jgi:hypothetical protein
MVYTGSRTLYVLARKKSQGIARTGNQVNPMIRIKKNKPQISPETKPFRIIRRLNLNRTYTPLKIGAIVGYILLGMLSASTSMFGILVGAVLRIAGF